MDVGKLVDFNLCKKTVRELGSRRDEMTIFPSFTTYNIMYAYELLWELSVVVAGEKIQFSGNHPATLLPAGYEDAYVDQKSKGR